jgi:hypothetical protein
VKLQLFVCNTYTICTSFLALLMAPYVRTLFLVLTCVQGGRDTIPPGRIVDLRVLNITDPDETGTVRVVLGFTEPGEDNFDNGGKIIRQLLKSVPTHKFRY